MENKWKEMAGRLKEVLGLESLPVGVIFANEKSEDFPEEKISVCRALKRAFQGEGFAISAASSACPGGSWHCGLKPPPSGEGWRWLQKFLTRGEKLTHSIISFHRMIALSTPPPEGMAEWILIGPWEKMKNRPDLVVFQADGHQACRLVTLDTYWDGVPPKVELSGSLCHSAIAYPAVSGSTNVTFGDWTARRMVGFPAHAVFVTVPFERMGGLLDAIPLCSAGEAELEPVGERPEE